MLVDDSVAMRKMITRVIASSSLAGVELVEAGSGEEALDILGSLKVLPDLVITDWNMPPGMNGLELVEEIRRREYKFPLGFITTENTAKYRDRIAAAGVSFHLGKPFQADEVQSAVLKAVGAPVPVVFKSLG